MMIMGLMEAVDMEIHSLDNIKSLCICEGLTLCQLVNCLKVACVS